MTGKELREFFELLETNPEAKEMYLREKKKIDDKYRKIIEDKQKIKLEKNNIL